MSLTDTFEKKAPSLTQKQVLRAAVITEPGNVEIKEFQLPEPQPGQLRIKLEGSGVCASNIPIWEGREWFNYPVSPGEPGHEGWGTVEAVGDGVENFNIGDRICCLSYHAYANYDITQADEAVKIPDTLKNVPFPGEPLGCAMNIFDRSDIKSGQTIAIVGSGFLGLLMIQLCKSAGAKVIALSRREFSLEIAKKCGADETIAMDDHWQIIEKVKELTNGNFCDRVIESTGKEWPLNLAIEITKVRGKLIVVGFHQDGMRHVNMQMLNWRGIDMINAHERDPQEYIKGMKKAIVAIEEGRMDPSVLYTHEFKLEELGEALDHLKKRPDGFVKALIRC